MEILRNNKSRLLTNLSLASNLMPFLGTVRVVKQLFIRLCKDTYEMWETNKEIIDEIVLKSDKFWERKRVDLDWVDVNKPFECSGYLIDVEIKNSTHLSILLKILNNNIIHENQKIFSLIDFKMKKYSTQDQKLICSIIDVLDMNDLTLKTLAFNPDMIHDFGGKMYKDILKSTQLKRNCKAKWYWNVFILAGPISSTFIQKNLRFNTLKIVDKIDNDFYENQDLSSTKCEILEFGYIKSKLSFEYILKSANSLLRMFPNVNTLKLLTVNSKLELLLKTVSYLSDESYNNVFGKISTFQLGEVSYSYPFKYASIDLSHAKIVFYSNKKFEEYEFQSFKADITEDEKWYRIEGMFMSDNIHAWTVNIQNVK